MQQELYDAAQQFRTLPNDYVRSRGFLVSIVMPQLDGRVELGRRSDAEFELARAALAALRWRDEHGRWPSATAEVASVDAPLRLEPDGEALRLLHTDTFEEPVEVRVEPRK